MATVSLRTIGHLEGIWNDLIVPVCEDHRGSLTHRLRAVGDSMPILELLFKENHSISVFRLRLLR